MRLRNVKNKDSIMNNSKFLIKNPEDNISNWNEVFRNSNPIEVELGMGKGKFIIEKAINNPNINYIGIERYDSVIVRALEKVPEDLKNIIFIRMNVIDIDKVFKHEISKVYLNFSDPWPKKRHALRRLTSEIYLSKYENIFLNEKIIFQRTDNKELFEYSLVSFNNYDYKIIEISLDLHNSLFFDGITTEYEDRFSLNGNQIYYVKVVKK